MKESFKEDSAYAPLLGTESLKDSIYVPLGEKAVQKQTRFYFDTNIIDNYLFFWVNKFVSV